MLAQAITRDDWTAAAAAARLVQATGGDQLALRVLRAQVARAATRQHSELDDRAVETLDLALRQCRPRDAGDSIPRQRRR